MKLKIGTCGICDRIKIGKESMGGFTSNESYGEYSMLLNDGTIAPHGVCRECLEGLDTNKVLFEFGRIRETWEAEMAEWGATSEAYERLRNLKVIAWGFGDDSSKYTVIKVTRG